MASSRDLVAQRNKLQSEILALERTLGDGSIIIDLISSDDGSDEESVDSGHAGEEAVPKNLEVEREQIQREISELEEKLGADAALVDVLTDSEHGTDSPVDSSDDEEELDLPQDLNTCLQLNLVYQEVLKEKLFELERFLNENREQQQDIEAQLSRSGSTAPGLPHLRLFLGSFMKPYFKDKLTGLGPPANEETKERMNQGAKPREALKVRRWEAWQKTLLIKSVVGDTMKRMLQPKMSRLDYLTTKMGLVTDEEKESIKNNIAILEREMANISSMKDEDLYGKRYEDHDWDKISNVDLEGLREPDDLKRFWQNYLHPSINKATWKEDEIEKLAAVAQEYNYSHWDQIADALGTNRSAYMCFQIYQRYISKTFKKREWTKEEDQVLRDLVEKMRIGNFIPYTQMSYFMEGREYNQLMYRWSTVLDPSIKKGPWSKEEDQLLVNAVKKYGCKDWFKIKNEVPGRTDNACRDRYLDCLREDVKRGTWSKEEVALLKQLVAKHGVGKWSKIAAEMPNRIDCQCLNKWKSMNRKVAQSGMKRRATTNLASRSKRTNVAQGMIKEETDSNFSSDDEKTVEVPCADNAGQEAEANDPPDDNLLPRQEYIQPDMKDWIPACPKELVHNIRWTLVRLVTEEKDKDCADQTKKSQGDCRNTVLCTKGYPVKTFMAKDLPAVQKWNISDEPAMFKVSADDVKDFLKWKRKLATERVKQKTRSRAVTPSILNYSLMIAITPWIGNVLVPTHASERKLCEADIVRRKAAKVPLVKTTVFMLFLRALKVDAEGCKKVILARKNAFPATRAHQSHPQVIQPAPGHKKTVAKTVAMMLAEAKKKKKGCSLELPDSVNLPQTIALPAISQQQSKPPQHLPPDRQIIRPSLIVPKNFIITQPKMQRVTPLTPVVQAVVTLPQPGAQVISQVPQSLLQLAVPVESGKLAQQSVVMPSLPTECSTETGTPKRKRNPTAKVQALLESTKGNMSKQEPVKKDQIPQTTAWILTPSGLMPIAETQVMCPLSPGQNPSPSVGLGSCNVLLLPSSNSNAPEVAAAAGKNIIGVPVVQVNTNVPASLTKTSDKMTPPNTACNLKNTRNVVPAVENHNASFVLLSGSAKPFTLISSTVPVVNRAAPSSIPSPAPNSNFPGVQSNPETSVKLPQSVDEGLRDSSQSSMPVTSHGTLQHLPTVQVGVQTPPVTKSAPIMGSDVPTSPVVPSLVTQQMVPQAEMQTIRRVVTTAYPKPSPDPLSFDANLVFSEPPDLVKHWIKGNGGITMPDKQNKMPYLPPFVSNITTLASLLKAKESFLKSAEQLLPAEERKNDETARVTAIRKLVAERFENNPAYLLLKARFMSCFTLPALLATIAPSKESVPDSDTDEEDDESIDVQKQAGDDQSQQAVPQLSTNENEVTAAQYSGLRPRKRRDKHVQGTPETS